MTTAPSAPAPTPASTSVSTSASSPSGLATDPAADPTATPTNRLQRWRLVLGEQAKDSCGQPTTAQEAIERALAALYDPDGPNGLNNRSRQTGAGSGPRSAGRGQSGPTVARWLGDIRTYFPSSVVQVMQRDALERLHLRQMLLEPEMLESTQPDVHLVASLVALSGVIPEETKATARQVVCRVVDELMARLNEPLRSAISGALDRSQRNRRPRLAEIDWHRTIRANLRHWQPDYRTIVPQTLVGYGRKARRPQREVILCIDQSGSMAASVVYSSIFGAVMASLPAVATKLVVFDTAVVDLTEELQDPVDLLFGVQLGGGTDINGAIGYCQGLIQEPRNTILVLISDLYEGGVEAGLLRRASELVESGVQFITLLALSDEGAPAYDRTLAAKLAALGVPSFACTPDAFPGLMAAAIRRDDINTWAAGQGIKTSRAAG